MSITHPMIRVYVGLGSNLDEPVTQVRSALDALRGITATRRVNYSSLYRSAPLGPADQPDYVNAVAALDTTLTAHGLLSELQQIERRHGRKRNAQRWGPRTLDLDLLLYGMEQIHDDTLTVPHPGLCERNFVLYPLYEIAPQLILPGLGGLGEYVARTSRQGLRQLEKPSDTIAS
jgi:2-amino-4-hydroxy-6-hydroxymethyldihydropteridine diphosphokinase